MTKEELEKLLELITKFYEWEFKQKMEEKPIGIIVSTFWGVIVYIEQILSQEE